MSLVFHGFEGLRASCGVWCFLVLGVRGSGVWSFGVSSSSAARISARLLGGWYMRLLLLLIILVV